MRPIFPVFYLESQTCDDLRICVGSFFHESARITLNELNHLLRKIIGFFEAISTPAGQESETSSNQS